MHACVNMLHVRSWYEVNYDNAEQLRYGQNLGCSFSEENCLTYGYANLMHNYTNMMCVDVFMHVAAIINAWMNIIMAVCIIILYYCIPQNSIPSSVCV